MPRSDWMTRWLNAVLWDATSSRVQRGWKYWQDGLVSDLQVGEGELHALVMGSGREPYIVSMRSVRPPVREEAWRPLLQQMGVQLDALRRAAMTRDVRLTIEANPDAGAGVLFQEGAIFSCTCLDWENPCKHAVALVYAFAAQIGENESRLLDLYWGNFADQSVQRAGSASVQQYWRGQSAAASTAPVHSTLRVDLPLRVKPPKNVGGAVEAAMAIVVQRVAAALEGQAPIEAASGSLSPVVVDVDP